MRAWVGQLAYVAMTALLDWWASRKGALCPTCGKPGYKPKDETKKEGAT